MKKCEICGAPHKRKYTTCSKPCTEILKKRKDEQQQQLVKEQGGFCCRICGRYTHGMIKHLKSFHKPMSLEEYNEKFNENVKAVSQFWIERNKGHTFKSGKDNPAYQHGGKFSPFSKNFIHADKVDIEATKEKAAQARRDHPENDTTRIEYWLKRTNGDVEKAKILLSERQATFSLQKCIRKHGVDEGVRIWKERQDKWQNTLNQKPNEEKIAISKKKGGATNSILEQSFYNDIKNEFGEDNIERQFVLIENDKKWVYDFILFGKIIVELNGDYWHMNPALYKGNDINSCMQESANEIWERDAVKKADAESFGYKVITLWESDYNRNGPLQTITKIKELLNESR